MITKKQLIDDLAETVADADRTVSTACNSIPAGSGTILQIILVAVFRLLCAYITYRLEMDRGGNTW